MSQASFPEYAIKHEEAARKMRLALPPPLRQAVDEIEGELCANPDRYPDRLSSVSRSGTTWIYRHPAPEIQITFEVDRASKIIYFFHYYAPTLSPQPTVFISYSHQDKEWLDKLRVFLTVLEQQGLIKFWEDGQLIPGEPWEKQIREVLDASKAGLLLVSQHFLISKFVKEVELPKLLEGAAKAGKKIYWLPLSPSTVFSSHKEITAYQSLLEDPKVSLEELDAVKQKKAFVDVTEKLMQHARAN